MSYCSDMRYFSKRAAPARRVFLCLAGGLVLLAAGTPARAAAPRLAWFGFDFVNTSPAPSSPAELARTARISDAAAAVLARSGRYQLVPVPPREQVLQGAAAIQGCNGCERSVAQKVGAQLAAYGWVQKVSNLILNLNIVIEDAATGRQVAGGSVDIRGNTDESWDHGLKFLFEEHVFGR
jgi:hypothetical protein